MEKLIQKIKHYKYSMMKNNNKLAHEIGLAYLTLSNLLEKKVRPHELTILRICKFLDLDPETFEENTK